MIYISMLRGINVGGHHKVAMKELKKVYEQLGLAHVTTYIQSGNVIFEAEEQDTSMLARQLEKAILDHFGFEVPVLVLSQQVLKGVIEQSPFIPINLEKEGTHFLVTFLAAEPSKEEAENLQNYVKAPEKAVLIDKALYLHCPNGYGRSKLAHNFIESKLKVKGTTRNWKSVCKIFDISLNIN